MGDEIGSINTEQILMTVKRKCAVPVFARVEANQRRTMLNDSRIDSIKEGYRKSVRKNIGVAQKSIAKCQKDLIHIKDEKAKKLVIDEINQFKAQIDELNKGMESAGESDYRVIGLANRSGDLNRAIVEAKALLETQDSGLNEIITSQISAENRAAKHKSTRTDLTMPSFLPYIGSLASSLPIFNSSSPMSNIAA